MADTMDIPRDEVLLGRCCECGIGLDPRTHPTMTCVNCLQARVLIAASRGLPAALRHRRASSPGENVAARRRVVVAGRITCRNPKADADEPPKTFTFDAVFAPTITQRKLYDVCSAPVVASVLEGFNGTDSASSVTLNVTWS